MLKVEGIHTFYGLSHILFGVSLDVSTGEIVCLLGRNGAGKSTIIKSIMGLVPPREGKVIYKGADVTGMKPYLLARMGIGYVPDDRQGLCRPDGRGKPRNIRETIRRARGLDYGTGV